MLIWEMASSSSSDGSDASGSQSDQNVQDDDHSREERPAGSSAQHARENTEAEQEQLPSSVRGAPQHMRDAIRRKQNMEVSFNFCE